MFMKTIAAAATIAAFATGASAITAVTVADALENGGSAIDILSDDGFQFQETFGGGDTGPLSFEFVNNGAGAATIVVSAGSIGQNGTFAFFTGGASIDWANAGNVITASQGVSAGGNLTFTLAGGGGSDTLVLNFGAAVAKTGAPDIDFFVTTVPLPAGVLLMGTALAGFGVAARRKNRKS